MSDQRASQTESQNGSVLPSNNKGMSNIFSMGYNSDSDTPDDDTFFCVPPTPITLSRSASETLTKLKTRCSTHIQCLRDDWRHQILVLKHGKNRRQLDMNSVHRDTGFLLTMSEKWGKHVFKMVRDDDTKALDKVVSKDVKVLVMKLKNKSNTHVEEVEELWVVFNGKKVSEVWVRYWKDMGLLMQTRDDEVKEIFRILIDCIKEGKIVKGADSSKLRQEPLTREEVLGQAKKDPAPEAEEEEESEPARKKARKARGGYKPKLGDWKCGVCGFWSPGSESDCQRKRKGGIKACSRKSGTDTAK